jgi:Rad3-related DNA helicase
MNFETLMLPGKTEIRPYQREVVTETYNRYMGIHKDRQGRQQAPHKSVLIESPTGSGKTVMG